MIIKVEDYIDKDMTEIRISSKQPELRGDVKMKLGIQFKLPNITTRTLRCVETNKILMIAGVMYSNHYSDKSKNEMELMTVFSEHLTNNFAKYFKDLYYILTYLINSTGVDFIVCLCYNSNIRGQKLLNILKFKEKDIESPLKDYKLLVYERKQ